VLPVIEPPALGPAMPKSAVRTQVRKRTVITDQAALLAAACAGGGKIHGKQVLVIDEKAVDALVRAGAAVPGATTETYEVIGAAGVRG
jgi:hypothetical protein